jgi:hypothetical protein
MVAPGFEKTFWLSLLFLEVYGMQYFSLKTLRNESVNRRPGVCRNLILLAVLGSVLFCLGFKEFMLKPFSSDQDLKETNILMLFMSKALDVIRIIQLLSSIVLSFLMTRKVKKMFINSREISKILVEHFKISESFEKNIEVGKRFLTFAMVCLIIQFFVIYFGIRSYDILISQLITLHFSSLLVAAVFKVLFLVSMVHDQLENLIKAITSINAPAPIRIMDNIFLHLIKSKNEENPSKKLVYARKMYNLITDNACIVNQSCGLSILLYLTSITMFLTSRGYETLVMLLDGVFTDKAPSTAFNFYVYFNVIFSTAWIGGNIQESVIIRLKLLC